jgi:hypothetical protein
MKDKERIARLEEEVQTLYKFVFVLTDALDEVLSPDQQSAMYNSLAESAFEGEEDG